MGLDDLYELLEAHPSIPIDKLLERTSPQFQRYIRRALDKVREARDSDDGEGGGRSDMRSWSRVLDSHAL